MTSDNFQRSLAAWLVARMEREGASVKEAAKEVAQHLFDSEEEQEEYVAIIEKNIGKQVVN